MTSKTKTTMYKCENCKAKFKKTCPETVILCQPVIKCQKCGGKLNKVN